MQPEELDPTLRVQTRGGGQAAPAPVPAQLAGKSYDPDQPRDEGGRWTIIGGQRVSISGQDVSRDDVAAAADRYGVAGPGKAALLAAHDAGKIKTDDHLLRSIAHGTESGDYAAAIAAHGVGGSHEGKWHRSVTAADRAAPEENRGKAPHELTRSEFAALGFTDSGRQLLDISHQGHVANAILQGKDVAARVLADYPDIREKTLRDRADLDARQAHVAEVQAHNEAGMQRAKDAIAETERQRWQELADSRNAAESRAKDSVMLNPTGRQHTSKNWRRLCRAWSIRPVVAK